MEFEILYTGHERKAREMILKNSIKTADELALMSSREVEGIINEMFCCYRVGEDWLLVPTSEQSKFNEIVRWIER